MKTQPRHISRRAFILMLALVLAYAAGPAAAQQRGRNRARPTAKTQTQESERARRAKALALLVETAEAARSLDDLFYRARLQALTADALWPFDPQRARAIFRRAWDAATASDKAEQEAAAQAAGAPPDEVGSVTEARDEVLAKTAPREPALADLFLRELMKDREDDSGSETEAKGPSRSWNEPSVMGLRRLELGYQLLDEGQTESAVKIVAPVTSEGASVSLIRFLIRLSEQDAAAGDAFYRLMIAQMRKDVGADPNTALLLSTPIVSPELIVAVDEYGALGFHRIEHGAPQAGSPTRPVVPPATRKFFFSAAAAVLLRPTTRASGVNETQDKTARYLAIGRLLPFFEREAAAYVPELQARMSALALDFSESRRDSLSSQLATRTLGAPPSSDPLRSHFEELARTSEQAERDRITLRIVLIAARNRSWDRARRAAAELGDEGLRRAANSFIAVNQVADLSHAYSDEKEDDYESIVSFLKSVEVPPLAAAWGYAQAAHVAARKKEPHRINELLTEAEHYAERVDANTNERVAAYAVIAAESARLDRVRAWELLTQLVKAANALENYAGDEASVEIRGGGNPSTAEGESPFTLTAEVFRLDSIFATMAQLDFERALASARALERAVPRVFAQLAIARAALKKER